MNKILLSTVLLFFPAFINANIYNAMQKFNMGEGQFKNECLDLKKMCAEEKIALCKQHINDCLALKNQFIERLGSEGCSEQLFKEKLAQKIALCERHMSEMKALCDRHHMEEASLYAKGRLMIDQFKAQMKAQSMMSQFRSGFGSMMG